MRAMSAGEESGAEGSAALLQTAQRHPHAARRAGARRPRTGARPRTPTSSTVPPAPASASWPGSSPPRCSPRERAVPATVAERVRREQPSRPDMGAASGAAEMLVGDIEEPVVAAAARTPFESARRVFVIEGAETMNDQAANRLLKTLEEPPAFVHLVLLTDRLQDVLPTIVSRCQRVRFDPPSPEEIEASLPESVEPERARACARLALGDGALARRLSEPEGAVLREAARGLRARLDDRGDGGQAMGGAARGRARGRRGGRRGVRAADRRRARAAARQGAQTPPARRGKRAGGPSGAPAPSRSSSGCSSRSCGCATCCASPSTPRSCSMPSTVAESSKRTRSARPRRRSHARSS